MKENVGRGDQIARSIVGPALMGLGYFALGGDEGRLGGLSTIVSGAVLVESAITRVCPLNALFGIDTRNRELMVKDYRKAVPHFDEEARELQEGYAPRAG